MRPRLRSILCTLTLGLGACQTPAPPKAATVMIEVPDEDRWTRVATASDTAKIESVAAAWSDALKLARSKGFGRAIANEGSLLDPGATLPRPAPTPGFYQCRILRFGAPGTKQRAFTAYKSFYCYVGVNEDRLALTKDTGSERPGGYLWDDEGSKTRLIFLGAVALGPEKAPLPYGENAARDIAGLFERVEDFRFRLVMPAPRPESRLDVMELVPAP
ncbi:DUF4893 domain-containing protein [Allosphingosinicella flava]|uniref:DUF4893 domain-containing protein n=1 Tax=Allosphingosinicella flava TaxID=2771430 RepID=A0A7T2GJF2_9SPHN|nr:DUF4893 domain-containing protein [Sphingosinicella flava]QPQ54872.1 DUF4893 domain-containing protein [Sphingosinicella flava]